MNDPPHLPDAFESICAIEQLYRRLMEKARGPHPDDPAGAPSLGGQLFYAGEIDAPGRVLVVAGNIAGAATLCATADVQAQKQAVRDGVVDFLVTSLDEALRILKNQVRKRETVAVCVGIDPGAVEREMGDRGVVPDVVRADLSSQASACALDQVLVTWQVDSAPVRWLPKLDAIALECVDREDAPARRWLRLAPRYLGRAGQNVHLVGSTRAFADRFREMVHDCMERGEIAATVRDSVHNGVAVEEWLLAPGVSS